MKLSVRGKYALRALIVLGREYRADDSVVRIQQVAEVQNIPKRFLEQILNDLKAAGIVESKRGVAGGYRLRRPPERITLAEVVRHIEGPLAPVGCVSQHFYEACSCPSEERCALRSVMKEVRDAIANVMEQVTVAQMCERARELERRGADAVEFVI
ncbi:MAG: Rrf2 family transcriptional regulator [Verrucomicrobia bacterium]|nr:Rrf2 family transcriptional regulator [Verrucomicrobiota bacterium]